MTYGHTIRQARFLCLDAEIRTRMITIVVTILLVVLIIVLSIIELK